MTSNKPRKKGKHIEDKILALLMKTDKPQGAYDILSGISKDTNTLLTPPIAYRTLNKLIDKGKVHKVDSVSGFVACKGHEHGNVFCVLLCVKCGKASELSGDPDNNSFNHHNMIQQINNSATESSFSVNQVNIEVKGLCNDCQ